MRGAAYAAASLVVLIGMAFLHKHGVGFAPALGVPAGILFADALNEWRR